MFLSVWMSQLEAATKAWQQTGHSCHCRYSNYACDSIKMVLFLLQAWKSEFPCMGRGLPNILQLQLLFKMTVFFFRSLWSATCRIQGQSKQPIILLLLQADLCQGTAIFLFFILSYYGLLRARWSTFSCPFAQTAFQEKSTHSHRLCLIFSFYNHSWL